MIVFIDSGVLGLLTNPKKQGKPAQCEDWLYSLLAKGVYFEGFAEALNWEDINLS